MDLFQIVGKFAITGADKAYKDVNGLTDSAKKSQGIFDTAFGKIATVVGTAFATDKIITFGKDLYQTSADVQAENAQFSASFADLAGVASEMFDRVSDKTGVFASRLQVTGTKAYSQFKGAGMEANDALEKTETFLNLASDASAYYDISLEDAEARIRSFLRGNVEAGDAIGLFTSESQRNTYAIEMYGKKWLDLTEAEKQNLMLNVSEDIYKQSGAMGQAQRESDGLANVMGNLQEVWRQFKAQIGAPLLEAVVPIFQKITTKLIEMKTYLDNNQDAMNGFKNIISGVGSVMNTLVDTIIKTVEWFGKHQIIAGACVDIMKVLTASFLAFKAGAKIQGVINSFQEAQVALSLYKLETGGASIAQGLLNGSLTLGQTVVGLLTGQISFASIATGIWTKVQSGLNVVLSDNPIGLVVMAIAGLIAIVVVAYNKFDWFRNIVNKLWDGIKNFGKGVINFFKNNWQSLLLLIVNPFAGAFKLLYDNCEGFRNFIKNFINGFKDLPERIGYFLGLIIGKVARFVVDLKDNAIEGGKNFVNGLIDFIKNLPSNVWNFLVNTINFVIQFRNNMINKAIETGREFVTNLLNWFKQLPNNVVNIGKNVVEGLWKGITNTGKWLKDKVTGFCSNIIDGFKKGFDTHSPSRITTGIGEMIAQGFGVGLDNDTSAENAVQNKVDSILGIANGSLNDIKIGTNVNDFLASSPMQGYQFSVNAQIGNLNNGIDKLTSLIATYLPDIATNSNKDIVLDTNGLAVGMSRKIDYQLGKLSTGKGRGNV